MGGRGKGIDSRIHNKVMWVFKVTIRYDVSSI